MTHMDSAILNNHAVNSYILKIYQRHHFFGGKTEKFKIAAFFPAIYPCI